MLERIHVYPVKSLAGVELEEAEVEPWGLRHDRRWLLLNPDGSVLTAREQHELLALRADPLEDGSINLTGRDSSTLRVDAPADGEHLPTTLSRLESVRSAGAEADHWFSDQLGQPVRLGWLDHPRRRLSVLKRMVWPFRLLGAAARLCPPLGDRPVVLLQRESR